MRQTGVRYGDEKAFAVRGQLLLELRYVRLRRGGTHSNPLFDKALVRRGHLLCKLLNETLDDELKRRFMVSRSLLCAEPSQ
jgi:hypothetical protein